MEVEIVTFIIEGSAKLTVPPRSTGIDPSRKQRCCSQSCLLSQAQRDTSDQDNSENLGYWLTIRHRCIDMWSWTEMLTVSFQEQRRYEFRVVKVQKYAKYAMRGAQLVLLEYWLSVGKPFPRRPRKYGRLETLACWLCHLHCTCFSNQNVPWRSRVLRDLTPKHCICDFLFFCEWKVPDDCCELQYCVKLKHVLWCNLAVSF